MNFFNRRKKESQDIFKKEEGGNSWPENRKGYEREGDRKPCEETQRDALKALYEDADLCSKMKSVAEREEAPHQSLSMLVGKGVKTLGKSLGNMAKGKDLLTDDEE